MKGAVVALLLVGSATLTVVDRANDRISTDPLTLGPADRVSERAFIDVMDVLVDDAGVWVLSGDEDFLTRLGPDGSVVSTLGAYGDGPNELKRPWVLLDGADGPTVLDPVEWRAVSVASGGSLLHSEWGFRSPVSVRRLLRHISHQDPFQVRAWRSGFVLARYDTPPRFPSDLSFGALIRTNTKGDMDEQGIALSDGSGQRTPFLSPMTLWEVCEGSLVTVHPSGRITWDDANGARTVVEIETDLQPVRRGMAARFLRQVAHFESGGQAGADQVDDAVRDALAQRPRLVARKAQAFTAVACGSDSIWLNRFDPTGDHLGRGDEWLSVSSDGEVAHFVAPRGFRPLKAFGDHMYGTVAGQDGFQFISSIQTSHPRG